MLVRVMSLVSRAEQLCSQTLALLDTQIVVVMYMTKFSEHFLGVWVSLN